MWLTTQSSTCSYNSGKLRCVQINHGRPHKSVRAQSPRDPVRDDVPSTAAACSFPAPRDVKETSSMCARVCAWACSPLTIGVIGVPCVLTHAPCIRDWRMCVTAISECVCSSGRIVVLLYTSTAWMATPADRAFSKLSYWLAELNCSCNVDFRGVQFKAVLFISLWWVPVKQV